MIKGMINHKERNILYGNGFGYSLSSGYDKSNAILARYYKDEKDQLLKIDNKDNLIIQLNPSNESGGNQPYQQNRIYDFKGKSPAHMAKMSCNSYAIKDEFNIRRLTPTECARLQTIPVWYEWVVSDSQEYKILGNAWTIEVIKHILQFINYDNTRRVKNET